MYHHTEGILKGVGVHLALPLLRGLAGHWFGGGEHLLVYHLSYTYIYMYSHNYYPFPFLYLSK